jgi:single-stranded DNA-specific DHH superfamily exonuclease
MVNLTLSIPAETKARMDKHTEIKWSNAIRNLIEQKLNDFEEAEALANKLDLSEKDLKPILNKINKDMAKHAEALLHENYD